MTTEQRMTRDLTPSESMFGRALLDAGDKLPEVAKALGVTQAAAWRQLGEPNHAHHWVLLTSGQDAPARCQVCGASREHAPARMAKTEANIKTSEIAAFVRPGRLIESPKVRDAGKVTARATVQVETTPPAGSRFRPSFVTGKSEPARSAAPVAPAVVELPKVVEPPIVALPKVVEPAAVLPLRPQLGHERLGFFCSRCDFATNQVRALFDHYRANHEARS